MKTVTGTGIAEKAPRRQHDRSFKANLVEQCLVPGASVAAIALAGGINANLLFKWRRDHLQSQRSSSAPSSSAVLVPVHLSPGHASDGGLQPLEVPPASLPLTAAAQRLAHRPGVIEVDIAGAQLRLRGPVDEARLCSVLRALRHSA